jgi:polyisoprenoid-binding protein YceI
MASIRYVLDVRSSQLTVHAFAEGLAGIAEHRPRFSIRDFTGEAELDIGKMAGALHLTARTASLELLDEVEEHDRLTINRVMFDEVLHPQSFPEVVFRSSRVACHAPAPAN